MTPDFEFQIKCSECGWISESTTVTAETREDARREAYYELFDITDEDVFPYVRLCPGEIDLLDAFKRECRSPQLRVERVIPTTENES